MGSPGSQLLTHLYSPPSLVLNGQSHAWKALQRGKAAVLLYDHAGVGCMLQPSGHAFVMHDRIEALLSLDVMPV